MSNAATMLEQYPADINVDKAVLAGCIDACTECAQTCTACADACLSEQMVADLTRCIRDNLDCSDQCHATAQVLSRHTGYDASLTRAVVEACRQACRTCGDSCEEHAEMHAHCKTCAESCRRCERACEALLEAIGASSRSGAARPQEAAPQH
jgi:hypothetical protein